MPKLSPKKKVTPSSSSDIASSSSSSAAQPPKNKKKSIKKVSQKTTDTNESQKTTDINESQKTTTKKQTKKSKKVTSSSDDDGEEGKGEDEYEYYVNEFKKIVTELDTVDGNKYNIDQFGDDIVCIIADFKKCCNILIRPDVDTMIEISNKKITNKKDRNDFIFGSDNGSQISIHDKIKTYTCKQDKNFLSDLQKKYKNL